MIKCNSTAIKKKIEKFSEIKAGMTPGFQFWMGPLIT